MKELKSTILELINKKEKCLTKVCYDIELCYKVSNYIESQALDKLKKKIENDILDLKSLLE